MQKRFRAVPADLACLGLILCWVVAFSYPYFFYSLTNNTREIQTYNLDTMVMLKAMKGGLASPWFHIRMPDYGHFYFNVAMVIAKAYGWFFPLSERAIVFILRTVSLIGGCALIAMVFVFARRFLGPLAAVFAAAVTGFSPVLVEYSNQVKPDTWQAFFLVLSFYGLARAFEPPAGDARRWHAGFAWVIAASAAAGAAFGSKYQGVFLAPYLIFAAFCVPVAGISDRYLMRAWRVAVATALPLGIALLLLARLHHERIIAFMFLTDRVRPGSFLLPAIKGLRIGALVLGPLLLAMAGAHLLGFDFGKLRGAVARRVMILLSVGLAFVVTFFLTSPWVFSHLEFFRELYLRSGTVGEGEHFGLRWLAMVFGINGFRTDFLFYSTSILALLGSIFLLADFARGQRDGARLGLLFMLAFVLIFLGLLVTAVNWVISNYAIPVVAPLVLLAAFGLTRLPPALTPWLSPARAKIAVAVLAALAIAAQIWDGASLLLQYPTLVVALSDENRLLGDWFSRCVPVGTRILAVPYSYVPPPFDNYVMAEGYWYLDWVKPQIVTTEARRIAEAAQEERRLASLPNYTRSDLARFYDVVLRSPQWVAGPKIGSFQIHMQRGFMLNPACQAPAHR